ncbi:hypothetical protein AJ79_06902 [Helicocarpus griseus UAMH5409]|uniref:F-box domain-containing protein n=1 Tax=Helicocarpus griseus UAMH5409 TaxID=1447875 RepID=A0A2B7X7H3_9EURO|nr:hypothetical protein AJ79_06902 [Helicocarpus griseus UAMH5409]
MGLGLQTYPTWQTMTTIDAKSGDDYDDSNNNIEKGYLTALPAEIFLEILQYVGADELRANNLKILPICKYWYCIASTVLMEDVKLSAAGLRKFLSLQQLTARQPQSTRTYAHQAPVSATKAATESLHGSTSPLQPQPQTRTQTLSIRLTGYSNWAALLDPKTQQGVPDRFKLLAHWADETRADIILLSHWLRTQQTLTHFRFQAVGESDLRGRMQAHMFEQMKNCYLHADAVALMCRSIPTRRLTVLELDTCGSAFISGDGSGGEGLEEKEEEEHICPLIGRYVPSLKRLRVRMHRICPEVFGIGKDGVGDGGDAPYKSAQKEFVFHLSLYDPLKQMMSAKSAVPCLAEGPCGRDVLINQMIEGANRAAKVMPNLKATILYHVYPFDLVAMDCRTGQSKFVDGHVDWLDNEDVGFEDEVVGRSGLVGRVSVCAL